MHKAYIQGIIMIYAGMRELGKLKKSGIQLGIELRPRTFRSSWLQSLVEFKFSFVSNSLMPAYHKYCVYTCSMHYCILTINNLFIILICKCSLISV